MSSRQELTSSLAESWKEELHKLAARFIQCRDDRPHEDGDEWKEAINLATSLVKAWVVRSETGLTVVPERESFTEKNKGDCLSCLKCGGVLHQVTTLSCGHSFCRKCAIRLNRCYKCNRTATVPPKQLQTNIAISTIVGKWWANELKAVELRYEGNAAVDIEREQYGKALEKYNQAAQIAPGDFTLLSNRSQCLSLMGEFEEALKDADSVIQLRPNWSKGHHHRASALIGLGRHESALLSLLHYAAMERTVDVTIVTPIVHDVAKELHAILSSAAAQPKTHGMVDPRTEMVGNTSRDTKEQEDVALRNPSELSSTLSIQPKLDQLIDLIFSQLEKLQTEFKSDSNRMVDPAKIDIGDFKCILCRRMMLRPVTTPCGHSFCLRCLERCMDPKPPICSLCQTSLATYLADRNYYLTEFLNHAMATYLPQQYAERYRSDERELREQFSSNQIPIYIGTMVFPTAIRELRVSEPRYLLMIRRCFESGYRQFGMCYVGTNQQNLFAEFGTLMEVIHINYEPDGTAIVNTVGVRRFKVLSRNAIDDYNTATVDFLVDEPVDSFQVATIKTLHDRVRQEAIDCINDERNRQMILRKYGAIPDVEPDWIKLPNGPQWIWWLINFLPVNINIKMKMLSITQIEKRLEVFQKAIGYARRTPNYFC